MISIHAPAFRIPCIKCGQPSGKKCRTLNTNRITDDTHAIRSAMAGRDPWHKVVRV